MGNEKKLSKAEEKGFPGYTVYPASEDIYNIFKKDPAVNPDDNSIIKPEHKKKGEWNEKDYSNELTGDDLDIPGNEINEDINDAGIEDEENDYFSLGGDNHNDLEEDNGGEPLVG